MMLLGASQAIKITKNWDPVIAGGQEGAAVESAHEGMADYRGYGNQGFVQMGDNVESLALGSSLSLHFATLQEKKDLVKQNGFSSQLSKYMEMNDDLPNSVKKQSLAVSHEDQIADAHRRTDESNARLEEANQWNIQQPEAKFGDGLHF